MAEATLLSKEMKKGPVEALTMVKSNGSLGLVACSFRKRESGESVGELITLRVSTVSQWHDISIEATSTFGELKMVLSLVTSLEPEEQRLLFKGKERDSGEYLHMVGVRDKDKVLLLEDPAIKERKLHGLAGGQPIGAPCRPISV
ncbi:hypothetical protein OIU85_002009 [Salix viminalis]|uniref:Ubiquitin-like domain-containing protein n=1 Tax=Salix viminalis TaxID=40686 RepID=A0A9Q0VMZ3_SALVM|nr:hypothetical protein OIU85_002009 [Salix viminalis]